MKGAVQLDLIPPEPPKNILETIDAKLPRRDWISVSDVAIAANVSVTLVYAWIDEGLVQSVNVGATKSYHRIFRPSVIKFYQSRLGIQP
jgi:hypothetical protein